MVKTARTYHALVLPEGVPGRRAVLFHELGNGATFRSRRIRVFVHQQCKLWRSRTMNLLPATSSTYNFAAQQVSNAHARSNISRFYQAGGITANRIYEFAL